MLPRRLHRVLVVKVEVAERVHQLLPPLGDRRAQRLLGDPQQLLVLLGVHPEVRRVLEHQLEPLGRLVLLGHHLVHLVAVGRAVREQRREAAAAAGAVREQRRRAAAAELQGGRRARPGAAAAGVLPGEQARAALVQLRLLLQHAVGLVDLLARLLGRVVGRLGRQLVARGHRLRGVVAAAAQLEPEAEPQLGLGLGQALRVGAGELGLRAAPLELLGLRLGARLRLGRRLGLLLGAPGVLDGLALGLRLEEGRLLLLGAQPAQRVAREAAPRVPLDRDGLVHREGLLGEPQLGQHARLEEDLAVADGVLVLAHVERRHHHLDRGALALLGVAPLVHRGPLVLGQDLRVLPVDLEVRQPVGEAHPDDAHRLEDARAAQLRLDHRRVELLGHLLRVGLDAAHKVQVRPADELQQVLELLLELGGDALELGLLLLRLDALHAALAAEEHLDPQRLRVLQQHHQVLRDRVLVLHEHPLCRVDDRPHKVHHREGALLLDRLLEEVALLVRLEQLLDERLVRALRHDALLVDRVQHAARPAADQPHDLRVVDVAQVGGGQRDALGRVLLLHRREDALVERRLQPLVAKVDAELLERVDLEGLEAEDVEDADELLLPRLHLPEQDRRLRLLLCGASAPPRGAGPPARGRGLARVGGGGGGGRRGDLVVLAAHLERAVDLRHQVVEDRRVHRARQPVAHLGGLGRAERLRDPLLADLGHLDRERALHRLEVHLEQPRQLLERRDVGELRLGVVAELELPEQHQRRDDAPQPLLRLGVDADVDERLLGQLHLLVVVPAGRRQAARPPRVVERERLGQLERVGEPPHAAQHVPDVVAALALAGLHDARLLEEVRVDARAHEPPAVVELQHQELAVARRVVVQRGLGVAKRLEDRVAREDSRLEALAPRGGRRGRAGGERQVLQHLLGRLRLARAGLAADDERLRAAVEQAGVGGGRGAVDVGRQRPRRRRLVRLHLVLAVDGQAHVRVQTNEQRVDPRVYLVLRVPQLDPTHHGVVRELREGGEIVRRIHLHLKPRILLLHFCDRLGIKLRILVGDHAIVGRRRPGRGRGSPRFRT